MTGAHLGASWSSARVATAIGLVTCMLAAACGSTVQRQVTPDQVAAPVGLPAPDGPTLGGGVQPSAPGQQPPRPAAGTSGVTGATGSTGSTAVVSSSDTQASPGLQAPFDPQAPPGAPPPGDPQPSDTAPAAPAGVRPAAEGVRGLANGTLALGLTNSVNGQAALEAAGIQGISRGDGRAEYEALLAHFNAQGGFAGRELVPVWFEYDELTVESWDPVQQAQCEHFTQDNETYLIVAGKYLSEVLFQCADNAEHAMVLSQGLPSYEEAVLTRYPRVMDLNSASLSQVARYYGTGLDRVGYFEPEAPDGQTRVGLVSFDSQQFVDPVENILVPSMAAIGHPIDAVAYITFPSSNETAGEMPAQISSAVLQFQAEGIDHVMFMETGGLLLLAFSNQAASQNYQPQYGLNTSSAANVIAPNIAPGQLDSAMQVGHLDIFDVRPEDDMAHTALRDTCDQIYTDAGITHPDMNAKSLGYVRCDIFAMVRQALAATAEPLDSFSIVRGLEALGSLDSSLTGPVTFGPGKHEGVDTWRPSAFDPACGCFTALGGPEPIPGR